MHNVSKKLGYIYKAKIIQNYAIKNSYGNIVANINNKNFIGWVREAGDIFKIGKTYETYLLIRPQRINWDINQSEQKFAPDPKHPNRYTFIGRLDYINSLRTYKKRLSFIECGVDCGFKIVIQTEVSKNILIKSGMYVLGQGGMEFDFVSIHPCNPTNKK